jgi:hypothetical protein
MSGLTDAKPSQAQSRSRLARILLRASLDGNGFKLYVAIFAALGLTYVILCIKTLALGSAIYGFADFHALWVSGVLAHQGQPLVNYDSVALHAKQVAMGINEHHINPFPYPPTLLLLLAPLGALPLPWAYWLFIGFTGAAYFLAMTAGRWTDFRWPLMALAAPATGISIIAGQSGLLTGALMIGGFRLATTQSVAAGVLFGLLTFKPQLGVLIPVALLAAGLWRVAASAIATTLLGVVVSGLVFGFDLWPAWIHQIRDYASEYDVVVNLMPTVYANVQKTAAGPFAAAIEQAIFSLSVGIVVWRAFREGVTERAMALVFIGTFLATPHAFNYDMPVTSAAIAAYLIARYEKVQRLSLFEALVVGAAFLTPLAILALREVGGAWSWAPLAAMFALLVRRDAWPSARGA